MPVASALTWKDTQVVAGVARTFFNGSPVSATVRVGQPTFFGCGATVASQTVPVDLYRYRYYDTSVGDSGNAAPLHLSADSAGRVWIVSEFHRHLKYYNPSTDGLLNLQVPTPALESQGPFWNVFTNAPTNMCQDGESVTVGPHGRVWFPQGGGEPSTPQPNHSRIVSYDPATSAFSVYNVPGNETRSYGIAVDDGYDSGTDDDRVWFNVTARSETVNGPSGQVTVQTYGPRIVGFLPKYQVSDGAFNYAAAAASLTCNRPDITQPGTCSNASTRKCLTAHDCVLADRICPDNVVYDYWCYHEYPIAQTTYPPDTPLLISHLALHPNDVSGILAPRTVWFTNYWGGSFASIGRLDTTYGAVRQDIYPSTTPRISAIFPNGPWDIRVLASNDVAAANYLEATLVRFHFADRLRSARTSSGPSPRTRTRASAPTSPSSRARPDAACPGHARTSRAARARRTSTAASAPRTTSHRTPRGVCGSRRTAARSPTPRPSSPRSDT